MKQSDVGARLRAAMGHRPATLLAIGPMSKNCVDAVIELGYEHDTPLMLIASRRQVDATQLGGGYVNNWTTEDFAAYVRRHDPERRIILARDHGGPWQNTKEVAQKLNIAEAMASAKRSYEVDITAGFDILHLDPSIDIHDRAVPPSVILERLFELYEHCMRIAQQQKRQLLFEVGTEEQSGQQQSLAELQVFLQSIEAFCIDHAFPKPFFVVVQTGTKVKETRNVGTLGTPFREPGMIPPEVHIAKLVELCEKFDVHLKEHNTDYLPDETLSWHPQAGIHAANVAPEFGVAETTQILRICSELGLKSERDTFLELAYESHKWEKWLTVDSNATDYDKAVMAGHYVLATPAFTAVKARIAAECMARGFDLDRVLRHAVKYSIRRYLFAFNLLI